MFLPSHNDMSHYQKKTSAENVGAVVSFYGLVRRFNRKKEVRYLEYEAHIPLAETMFLDLERVVKNQFGVFAIAAVHRVGKVEVGDPSVIIDVFSQHRKEAFLACHMIIDELKRNLPIWRKEVYSDNTFSFETSGECHHSPVSEGMHDIIS